MRYLHPLKVSSLILLAAVALSAVGVGGETVRYETPKYRVLERIGKIEIREYEPYLAAETTVDGSIESAGNRGFPVLAKYIFGGNQGARKISMTAPVNQAKSRRTRIAMTTPVTQERTGERYVVQFMMPSKYTREELPVPNDRRVEIVEVPARRLAAVRYSGTWSKRNYEKHLAELIAALQSEGYEPAGEPVWARYNPPFTPWFLRRNEILTEVEAPPLAIRD